MSQIIPIEVKTPAQRAADIIANGVNGQLRARVSAMRALWERLWENTEATPQEILTALGPRGVLVLQAGAQSVADLTACAAIAGTTVEALVGDAKYLTTKLPVSITEDGVVTISDD